MVNNSISSNVGQGVIDTSFKLKAIKSDQSSFELDIDFTIPASGVTAIFGESGSGKTTLLRCIAGLQKANTAKLIVNGEVWQNHDYFKPTHKRSIGYVFQEPSLFEHLTVKANLAYGIKRSKQPLNKGFYEQVVKVMGVLGLLDRSAKLLSGGEKQRVAIARALLAQPVLLLMDEPLASLDTKRKLDILPYIETLRMHFGIPVLYVTHSVDEIVRLADRVLVLQDGKLIKQGEVPELFSQLDVPLQSFNDIGAVVDCSISELDEQWQLVKLVFDGGYLWLPKDLGKFTEPFCRLRILASDVSVTLQSHPDSSVLNQLMAELIEVVPEVQCATRLLKVKVGSTILLARVTNKSVSQLGLTIGQKVWVQVKSAAIIR